MDELIENQSEKDQPPNIDLETETTPKMEEDTINTSKNTIASPAQNFENSQKIVSGHEQQGESPNGNGDGEKDEENCQHVSDTLSFKLDKFLTAVIIYRKNLTEARAYLIQSNKRRQLHFENQFSRHNHSQQPGYDILYFLLKLANVESLLSKKDFTTTQTYVTNLSQKVRESCGEDGREFYTTQKLQLALLQRAKMFEAARKFATDIYDHAGKKVMENENDHKNSGPHFLKMADQLVYLRRFEEALSTYEKVRENIILTQNDQTIEEDDEDTYFYVQNKIIRLLIQMRRLDQAMELSQEVMQRQKQKYSGGGSCDENHFTILKTMYHISVILKCKGQQNGCGGGGGGDDTDYKEALRLAEIVASNTKKIEPNPTALTTMQMDEKKLREYLTPKMYPVVELNLVELKLFNLIGRPEGEGHEVRGILVTTLANVRAKYGPHHPYVLDSLFNVAVMWFQSGNFKYARDLFSKVLRGQAERWGMEDPAVLETKRWIADCHKKLDSKRKCSVV